MQIIRLDAVDSTSRLARREITAGRAWAVPTAIIAATQTRAMGRQERVYSTPRGGLWLTVAWPFAQAAPPSGVINGLGLRLGVELARAVAEIVARRLPDSAVELKWPNDVLLSGRKVLGVLTEVAAHGPSDAPLAPAEAGPKSFVLVGVGLNANFSLRDLPAELHERADTLADALGGPIDLAHAEARLLAAVSSAVLTHDLPAQTLAFARRHLAGRGSTTRFTLPGSDATIEGEVVDINDQGMLVVRTANGDRVLGMPVPQA